MKLVCSQPELNSALQLVSRAVSSRPTHPVLANVLLTADAGIGKLSLTGFDLNLGIQTSINASVEISGAITLPAKLFVEIVSKLSTDCPLTLVSDDSSQQIDLISNNGNYKVRGMLADDYPDLPMVENGTTLKIKPDKLVDSLKSTLFASSSDDAKQLLTGVHLNFDGSSIEAAATDGHRLAVSNLNNAFNSKSFDESIEQDNISITLPARSLKEVEKFIFGCKKDDFISLFIDQGQVVFLSEDQVITTRTLDGTYPNYKQLIPENFSHTFEFNRKDFISGLERIAVLADQHNNVIKISIDNNTNLLNISTEAQDIGSGSESLPVISSDESIQIAFNARYLLDGLKVIQSDIIKLECNAPTTPAIFSPVDDNKKFLYLVMPVQIRT